MAGRLGDEPGGILTLLELIEEHRAAFEYDWRVRFHLSLAALPATMDWGEALRLTSVVAADPSSALSARLNGWSYPLSFEGIALAELIDRLSRAHFKKPKPYPRPWPDREKKVAKPTVSQDQVIAALRFAGHEKPPPLVA